MYDIIDACTLEHRQFIVRNLATGRDLRAHRFYEDALAHKQRLVNARVARLKASNARHARRVA